MKRWHCPHTQKRLWKIRGGYPLHHKHPTLHPFTTFYFNFPFRFSFHCAKGIFDTHIIQGIWGEACMPITQTNPAHSLGRKAITPHFCSPLSKTRDISMPGKFLTLCILTIFIFYYVLFNWLQPNFPYPNNKTKTMELWTNFNVEDSHNNPAFHFVFGLSTETYQGTISF